MTGVQTCALPIWLKMQNTIKNAQKEFAALKKDTGNDLKEGGKDGK